MEQDSAFHPQPRIWSCMPRALSCLIACLAALLPSAIPRPASATPAPAVLERVVLVARHGVRSPTQPLARINAATRRIWPAWPVAPGELTLQGQHDLALMGAALGAHYRQAGLLPPGQACRPGALAIWSDAAAHRTMQTGGIMGQAMLPGCAVTNASLPAGTADPVFNSLPRTPDPTLRAAIMTSLTAELADDQSHYPAEVNRAQALMQDMVYPAGCVAGAPCFTGPDRATWKKNAPHLEGGLSLSAEMAENMLLEYAQGMPPDSIGWGHADMRRTLDAIMPAHTHASRLLRRLPAFALARGHVLAGLMTDLAAGRPVTLPDHSVIAPTTPVILFAGHDTTLDMLAAIFGLDWSFADLPDPTGPDTTLGFETWRQVDGTRMVRAVIFHQGLDALRSGQPGVAQPDVLPLPACQSGPQGQCKLDDFVRVFTARLNAAPA
ncbi:phosphoanhydride phosphohydrolase [Komagataeibacter melaceti]|uniref:Phosphoanhydride phosphohydrolase n=2 Tax=Komagataeibacter melaceti TaxID=2766577 RepID=A0A371YZM4_9PROT|nr:phosphoanhydride phosphohydrolase [Komagataeibacter melaceti]